MVVHINTMKGMGLAVAEANKEAFHFHAPFDLADGAPLRQPAAGTAPENYTTIFADHMLELMRSNPRLALLNAGTPGTIGFTRGVAARRATVSSTWASPSRCTGTGRRHGKRMA